MAPTKHDESGVIYSTIAFTGSEELTVDTEEMEEQPDVLPLRRHLDLAIGEIKALKNEADRYAKKTLCNDELVAESQAYAKVLAILDRLM